MFADEGSLWRRAEIAWADWLSPQGYSVFMASDHHSNAPGTSAPMLRVGGQWRRVPDVMTNRAGVTEYWEVKSRTRADVDELTGQREHWMSYDAFRDYVLVAQGGTRVWVVLYEVPSGLAPGRWLRIDVGLLRDLGRRGTKYGRGGRLVDAWTWPVDKMQVVNGPPVTDVESVGLLPNEGEQEPLPEADLQIMERRSRRPVRDAAENENQRRAAAVLGDSTDSGLDVLSSTLGLPRRPHYSVLCLNPDQSVLDDLLGILEYGIRLFVVTDTLTAPSSVRMRAFAEARMLEWATAPGPLGTTRWVIDGQVDSADDAEVNAALSAADDVGGLNVRQYRIVHEHPDSDVMVMAGAGTGKTETMAERFVFLLATSGLIEMEEGSSPHALRADEIALITFTRDAAAQMRERLARTLMLRQRLASRCALPALAWLMQLSGAPISTIHSFAKRLAQSGGPRVGLSPAFSVSDRTMEFRALLERELSLPLGKLLLARQGNQIPAAYEWETHVKAVWDQLSNNGVDLLGLTDGVADSDVDWGRVGSTESTSMDEVVATYTREIIHSLASAFREDCIRAQAIPTGQLVALAIASLPSTGQSPAASPKYLFVDEFQDTDRLQIELILGVRDRAGSRLFIVGDAKQGVYRFRGAAGDAFQLFRTMYDKRDSGHRVEHTLTRNFRSGQKLLDSLHPFFESWASKNLLTYEPGDRLLPQLGATDDSDPVQVRSVVKSRTVTEAALQVAVWRRDHPNSSIGILCRRNHQAIEIQREIREIHGLPCEIRVGGAFFASPAVRELRVLLEAVANPADDAALLELCETRWAPGLLGAGSPDPGLAHAWNGDNVSVHDWSSRLSTLAQTSNVMRNDLEPVRLRVRALRERLDRVPTIAWIVDCTRMFIPEGAARTTVADDETERTRYARCLDQLLTRLDAEFQDSPATLDRVLSWLRLQIATNRSEDEESPTESVSASGAIVSLTVHKAKGLEFDFVLIPHLATSFAPSRSRATNVAVLDGGGPGKLPRLAWRWRPVGSTYSNVADQALWRQEHAATAREEARLLYVAMTRAEKHLTMFMPPQGPGARVETWADLIGLAGH
ncbi:UvrD-helicase domain-containing protein [Isoptericola sp. QY 916]|uniref:UvrD-helicase domain-containing protein n=1 Tax=Isoptericola sp. QY 916 TaxID=2782570 RepID=UPI003D2FF517|nr:UvrD-helicase domain-containing protein [Isoptericola sp. QY 916]